MRKNSGTILVGGCSLLSLASIVVSAGCANVIDGGVDPSLDASVDGGADASVDCEGSSLTFWYDADEDLHAPTWSSRVVACSAPTSAPEECPTNQTLCPDDAWVSFAIPTDDCDDAVATRYPGAPEICNREDDNCDADGGVEVAEDVDNDGFTDVDYASCSGGFPKTDCYDKDPNVRPDQTSRFDVGYCLQDNAQFWCFERSECAKKDDCMDSIGQEWGPGSVDYNCNGVEEPFTATPPEAAAYSTACENAAPPDCVSPEAPTYAVSGAPCAAIGQHSKCSLDSGSGTCKYSSEFLMTACH